MEDTWIEFECSVDGVLRGKGRPLKGCGVDWPASPSIRLVVHEIRDHPADRSRPRNCRMISSISILSLALCFQEKTDLLKHNLRRDKRYVPYISFSLRHLLYRLQTVHCPYDYLFN